MMQFGNLKFKLPKQLARG